MKNLDDYKDEKGWIGHFSKDSHGQIMRDDYNIPVLEFGDGVQRMSMNALCEFVLSETKIEAAVQRASFMRKEYEIWLPSGEPVRHWSRNAWYGKPGTMSGDQLEPLVWCYVVFDMQASFWELFFKLLKRGFFAWNTKKIGQTTEEWKPGDFFLHRMLSPTFRMLLKTKYVGTLAWPFIIIWDVFGLGLNTLVRIVVPIFDRENTGDDLNYFVSLLGSRMVGGNFATKFWSYVYLRFRPKAKLNGEVIGDELLTGCESAFQQYFYEEAAPPLHENLILIARKLQRE